MHQTFSLLFLFLFTGFCVGEYILPEGPVDVILGKDVTLKVLYKKQDGDIFIWNYSDGKDTSNVAVLRPDGSFSVGEAYKGRASINTTNGYLTLKSLKSEDSGDYDLTIVGAKTLSGAIEVRVLEPVTDVVIKSDLPEAIEHNSTVVLTCSSKGSHLTFTWLNKTKPIVIDGDRITKEDSQDGLSSKLTIRDVLRNDLSQIVCRSANTLQKQDSAPFNLNYRSYSDVLKSIDKKLTSLDALLALVEVLHKEFQALRESLEYSQAQLASVTAENEALRGEVTKLTEGMIQLSGENKKIKESILDIRSRSRRDSLVFSGIAERQEEDPEVTIHDFLQQKLKIPADQIGPKMSS